MSEDKEKYEAIAREAGFSVAHPGIDKRPKVELLLKTIKERLPELQDMLEKYSINHEIDMYARAHWYFEDAYYRAYHRSAKIFRVQEDTKEIVEILRSLLPGQTLDPFIEEIFREGTNYPIPEQMTKKNWDPIAARHIMEAFAHATFLLSMCVKYSKLESPPTQLPAGWGAVLILYQIR